MDRQKKLDPEICEALWENEGFGTTNCEDVCKLCGTTRAQLLADFAESSPTPVDIADEW